MVNGDSGSTVSTPRRGRRGLGILLLIVIVIAIGLFIWAEQQRREVAGKLEQTEAELEEIRRSTQRGGEEVANEVLTKLRSHMVIPEEPQPTVATIVDIDRLKEASEFYQVAENGDHLIITEKRAILYDPDTDLILDVVPVRINQDATSPAASPPAGLPAATSPSPAVSPPPAP